DHKRPGLWSSLVALKPGYVWVVRNLNRIARDVILQETIIKQLRKSGATLASMEDGGQLPDDPQAKLVRQILGALAEYQREINNARTRAKMLAHQRAGRVMGTIPYG